MVRSFYRYGKLLLTALSLVFIMLVVAGTAFADNPCIQMRTISSGYNHVLLLQNGGSVIATGDDSKGQRDVPASLTDAVAVSAGNYHSLALKSDGTVVGWGDNSKGQITPPTGLSGVAAVAAGAMYSLALNSDGTVVAWGDNTYTQGTIPAGLTDVVAIATGGYHSLALKKDGSVVAWGNNSTNQTAVPPAALSGVVAIAAGIYHSLALKSDGTVIAWGITSGSNFHGQATVPPDLTDVVAIAGGGFHSLALKKNGTVVAWGYNNYQQASVPSSLSGGVALAAGFYNSVALKGDGTVIGWGANTSWSGLLKAALPLNTCQAITITPSVNGIGGSFAPAAPQTVSRGSTATFTVVPDSGFHVAPPFGGTCPQGSYDAATGNYTTGPSTFSCSVVASFIPVYTVIPAVMGSGGTIVPGSAQTVEAGSQASFTLIPSPGYAVAPPVVGTCPAGTLNGNSYATGLIYQNCSVLARFTPIYTVTATLNGTGGSATPVNPQAVPSGRRATFVFTADSGYTLASLMGGSCPQGSFNGNSYTTGPLSADCTLAASFIPSLKPNLPIRSIAVGGKHSLALWGNGTVAAWGLDDLGQATVPPGLFDVVQVAAGAGHSLALRIDGTVVAWGDNGKNQASVPPGLAGVVAVAAGSDFSLALKSDGTVVSWGGSGSNHASVPTGLTGVIAIAAGSVHALALKKEGTVVAWGDNASGQVNVPGNLTGVVAVSAGTFHSLALKSDGTVVAWGDGGNGESAVPNGLTDVESICAGYGSSLAMKSDGTPVSWGVYWRGTVPDGLTGVVAVSSSREHDLFLALLSDGSVVSWGTGRPSPVQQLVVPGGLTAALPKQSFDAFVHTPCLKLSPVSAGIFHSLALKSDGTVAAWGGNGSGQSNVPPGLSGVAAVSAGGYHSLALKRDGTVAAWGHDDEGETDVPSDLSGVVAVSAGTSHSLALRGDGTVKAWGYDDSNQIDVPAGLSGVVAISAGSYHSLALKSDGTVAAWGSDGFGESSVPPGLSGVVAISAGNQVSLALKNDGTVVSWGGIAEVPPGLSGVVAISAGNGYTDDPSGVSTVDHPGFSLALKSDGTVVAWGENSYGHGENNIPAGLTGVVAISSGSGHVLALKGDGSVAAWGDNSRGQTTVPPGLTATLPQLSCSYPVNSSCGSADGKTFSLSPPVELCSAGTASPLTGTGPWSWSCKGLYGGTDASCAANFTPAQNGSCGNSHGKTLTASPTSDLCAFGNPSVITGPGPWYWSCSGVNGGNAATCSASPPNDIAFTFLSGANGSLSGQTNQTVNSGARPSAVTARPDSGFHFVNWTSSSSNGDSATYTDNPVSLLFFTGVSFSITLTANFAPDAVMVCGEANGRTLSAAPVTGLCATGTASAIAGSGPWYWNCIAPEGAVSTGCLAHRQGGGGNVRANPISAGVWDAAAVKDDGSVVSWGRDLDGLDENIPAGLAGVVAVAAGNSHFLALKSDGTVAAWGLNPAGETAVPAGLSGVVAVAAGYRSSLALMGDGTVTAWGDNSLGQTSVPAGLTDVVSLATGGNRTLAVKGDGSVVSWGTAADLPAHLSGVIAVAVPQSGGHALALKGDGSVVAWGGNGFGQSTVPANLVDVVAIAAGNGFSLALKGDGTVAAWGDNGLGQTGVPPELSGVVAIAAGDGFALALKRDGSVVGWGDNGYGQLVVPRGTVVQSLPTAPAIRSATRALFPVGTAGTFTVVAAGSPAPTLSVSGALPAGVSFDAGSGVLHGTPAVGTARDYPLTFTAGNGVLPDGVQNFVLTVGELPALTGPPSVTFAVAAPGSFTVAATGWPTATLSETGLLPAGISFDPTTGLLSGTAAAGSGGSYPLSFTAQNGTGAAIGIFTLRVEESPAVSAPSSVDLTVGAEVNLVITAAGYPAPTRSVAGTLPAGIVFNPVTGTLTGAPAFGSAGSYPLTVTATNGIGSAAGNLTLRVSNRALAIISAPAADFTVGVAGAFTVTATGTPAPTLGMTGNLPSGLAFNQATGVLSGTPAAGSAGNYRLTFTATGGTGNFVQNFTLAVAPLADHTTWQAMGPFGAAGMRLAADPGNTQTIYLATRTRGVFKTGNGGASWTAAGSGLTSGVSGIDSLAVDPGNSRTVYAGTMGGIFKSTDGGALWVAANVGLPDWARYSAIVVDPGDSRTLYAGGNICLDQDPCSIQVYKSSNGGSSWSRSSTGLSGSSISSLAMVPGDSRVIFAGTGTGVFKSVDGGSTWAAAGSSLSAFSINSLAVADARTIYAGTKYAGIYKSDDGGSTWSPRGFWGELVTDIAVDPKNASTVYAAGEGVFQSIDGGSSWTAFGQLASTPVFSIVLDPGDSRTLYAGSAEGVYKHTADRDAWEGVNSGLTASSTLSVAVDHADSRIVYAGEQETGIYKSKDGGVSWFSANSGLDSAAVQSLAIDPGNGQVLYAGTLKWIFKTVNGGTLWTQANGAADGISTDESVLSLAIDPGNSRIVYAGTLSHGIYRSSDGGESWQAAGLGLPADAIASLALADGMTLYAGTGASGIYKSVDGGSSWAFSGLPNQRVNSIAIDPSNTGNVYAGGVGVFKSVNGGAFWTPCDGFPDPGMPVNSLMVDPGDAHIVWAAGRDGVFKSTNRAVSWFKAGKLPNVTSLGVAAADSRTVYAGTPNGIYKTLLSNGVPVLGGAAGATFREGVSGSFQLTADGWPASVFTAAGNLPDGVALDRVTGILSGIPAGGSAGSYPLLVTASNGFPPDATRGLTLTVLSAGAASVAVDTPANNSKPASLPRLAGSASGSGISRVEVQVTDGVYYLQQNGTLAATSAWVAAVGTASWSLDTGSAPFVGGIAYTVAARALDGGGATLAQAGSSFTMAVPNRPESVLSLILAPETLRAGESSAISGSLVTGSLAPLSGQSVQLIVTPPSTPGNPNPAPVVTVLVTDQSGGFATGNLSFGTPGVYRVEARFDGSSTLAPSSATRVLAVTPRSGYAIIVTGKALDNSLLGMHGSTADMIYATLLQKRGFLPDDIRYLKSTTDLAVRKEALQDAITGWARDKLSAAAAPLYLIMIDHGTATGFVLGDETVTPDDLRGWLESLEGSLSPGTLAGSPRFAIIGSCYSGAFVPKLVGQGRIVITSAASDERSIAGFSLYNSVTDTTFTGGEFFIDSMFNFLGRGDSFADAFRESASMVALRDPRTVAAGFHAGVYDTLAQHPLLDDNGDGQGSYNLVGSEDGVAAAGLTLGVGRRSLDNPADIALVTPTSTLSPDQGADFPLWLQVNDDSRVAKAWLEIRTPDSAVVGTGAASGQVIPSLVTLPLYFDGVRWQTGYSFSAPGTYNILYYTQDNLTGDVSPAAHSVVYKQLAANPPPAPFLLASPDDNGGVSSMLALSWQEVSSDHPLTYTLLVSTDPLFDKIVYREEGIPQAATYIADGKLTDPAGTGYYCQSGNDTWCYWKVQAIDGFGAVTESDRRRFAVVLTNGLPGVVMGYVRDGKSGLPLVGAKIANTRGVQVAASLSTGVYVFTNMPGSMYLTAGMSGYQPATFLKTIAAGGVTHLDFNLTPTPPVAKTSQSIGPIVFSPPTLKVGGESSAGASGGDSGNPVVFGSDTPEVCKVGGLNGATVTALAPGNCTITADQTGNDQYAAATRVTASIAVNPVVQKPGDCNFDGTVDIGEVQGAVNMYLGITTPRACVDLDGDHRVGIGEIQKAINGFLGM